MTQSYMHRVKHHAMKDTYEAFEATLEDLERSWTTGVERLEVSPADTLGAGDQLRF